jgi:hypothetical protein
MKEWFQDGVDSETMGHSLFRRGKPEKIMSFIVARTAKLLLLLT